MKPKSPSGPSQRQLRVAEQIRHAIVETLQRGKFHNMVLLDISHMVTITEVKASPDLKYATAYVLAMGNGRLDDEILPALNEEASVFQKEIGKKLKLRFTPKLRFVEDDSFAKSTRIDEILHNLPKTAEPDTLDPENEDY